MILDRSTCQNDPAVRLEPHCRRRRLRVTVLDRMRLIQADACPRTAAESVSLRNQQSIGKNQQFAFPQGGNHPRPFGIGNLIEHHHIEPGSKAIHLAFPVADHRSRRNNHLRTAILTAQQHGNTLQSLAQTHVIGKADTRTPIRHPEHPADAILLIITQIGIKTVRNQHQLSLGLTNTLTQSRQSLRLLDIHIAADAVSTDGICQFIDAHLVSMTLGKRIDTPQLTPQRIAQAQEIIVPQSDVPSLSLPDHSQQLRHRHYMVFIQRNAALDFKPSSHWIRNSLPGGCVGIL